MPIRAFEYGLLEPRGNADLVETQMRDAHRYRNVLVEIERERRAKVAAILAAHPDLTELEEQLRSLIAQRDEARGTILQVRRVARARSESAQQRQTVRTLNDAVKALRDQVKAIRKTVATDPAIRAQFQAAEDYSRDRIRKARATCNVYWGTYLLQEADADAARTSKTPPKFVPWRGEGRVSVQLQGGLSLDELWGDDTQLHIAPVAAEAHDQGTRRGDRRRASRTVLRLRVGSVKGKPVWAEWPMILHRPLPPGTRIKVATVSKRRRDCRTWFWRLHLTVDMPDAAVRPAPAGGIVALNMGFCIRDNTVRAGYLVGDDGYEQEILLPPSVKDAVEKSNSIQGFRDRDMDVMRPQLSAWIPGWLAWHRPLHEQLVGEIALIDPQADAFGRLARYIAFDGPALPYWLARRTTHLYMWRSARRFRDLAFEWRKRRFRGDSDGYELLEAWRYRDEHLERYETNMRRTALLRRRESYRIIAAQMAARYRTLVIDNTDLRDFQRSPPPESEKIEITHVKANQRLAAGSQLRGVFQNAFGKERTAQESATDITRRGNCCGTINEWDRTAAGRLHQCQGCGVTWDQDANACRNLIAAYRRSIETTPIADPTTSKPKATRSQRLRANKGTSAA